MRIISFQSYPLGSRWGCGSQIEFVENRVGGGLRWCELREAVQKTIILVTHDARAAQRAHRIQYLDKGRLVTSDALLPGA